MPIPQSRLIAIAGKKQSGKDVAFEFIRAELQAPRANKEVIPVIRYNMADGVKRELSLCLGVSVEWIEDNKNQIRGLLQHYGTEYRRRFYGQDYWIKQWQQGYELLKGKIPNAVVVCTDVRFRNEYDFLRDLDATIWRISAINKHMPEDSHISENELDAGAANWDAILENNFEDIYSLKQQIHKLLS